MVHGTLPSPFCECTESAYGHHQRGTLMSQKSHSRKLRSRTASFTSSSSLWMKNPVRLDQMSTCRHTAIVREKASQQRSGPAPRQIVGFSLAPATASEVKMEAARRGISLKALFDEMWMLY